MKNDWVGPFRLIFVSNGNLFYIFIFLFSKMKEEVTNLDNPQCGEYMTEFINDFILNNVTHEAILFRILSECVFSVSLSLSLFPLIKWSTQDVTAILLWWKILFKCQYLLVELKSLSHTTLYIHYSNNKYYIQNKTQNNRVWWLSRLDAWQLRLIDIFVVNSKLPIDFAQYHHHHHHILSFYPSLSLSLPYLYV